MADGTFDKPSDYSEGGEDGGASLWVWIGGGCAVLFLIGAVLLTFGAYKGFSFCQETLETQQKAQVFAIEYARSLRDGDYGAAWNKSTESFRQRTSRESFEQRVEQYAERLQNSAPEPRGVNRHMGREASWWEVQVAFMPHGGETFVMMSVRATEVGDGDEASFRVDRLRFREMQRDLVSERPVRRVQAFNEHIAEGRTDRARQLVGKGFSGADSKEAFRSFVENHRDLLGRAFVRVESVRYDARGGVTVDVLQDRRDGERANVRYRLRKSGGGWRITKIAFDVQLPGGDSEDATTGGDVDGGSDEAGEAP